MKNLSFVLWVLLWPLIIDIDNWLNGYTVNDMTEAELWFVAIVWFGIGALLYENNKCKEKK